MTFSKKTVIIVARCRCRLAVWRQLPKLLPASSTLVTCSKNRQTSQGVCRFYLSMQIAYITQKRWQWSIDKQKIYAIIRSRLQAKQIKKWGYYWITKRNSGKAIKKLFITKRRRLDRVDSLAKRLAGRLR